MTAPLTLPRPLKRRAALFALCWLAATVLMLLISRDSYLYDIWWRGDTNWFMTCGRAWMEGLTPYADFADSKGPLLWLIYGIGYLLSPHDFTGVMWLSTISYAVVFYYAYSTMRLVGASRWSAACGLAVTALLLLNGYVHDEVRAEDFCQAFIAPVLYRFVKHDSGYDTNGHSLRATAATLGFALAATLLIKYSVTLMLVAFVPHVVWVWPRRWRHRMGGIWLALVAGVLAMLLPWAILAWWQGWLGDFVREYFVNTFTTLGNLGESKLSLTAILGEATKKSLLLYMAVIAATLVFYGFERTRRGWGLLVIMAWMVAVVMINGKSHFYYSSLALLATPGIARVMTRLDGARWGKVVMTVIALAALLGLAATKRSANGSLFTHDLAKRDRFYYYAGLMCQVEHPRVLFWDLHDKGQGMLSEALPACRYWALQEGATDAMRRDQERAAREGTDFVFIDHEDSIHARQLDEWGYTRYDYWSRRDTTRYLSPDGHVVLYSRRPLRDTLIKVTNEDVLFKRDLLPRIHNTHN